MFRPGDGLPGDLYIVLSVKEHDVFERDGENIIIQADVTFPLLTLGGQMKIPTLEGETEIVIPAGTQPGKVIRLKGLGVAKTNGYGRGDQLVYLNIVIPQSLTERQKGLLEELAREFNGDAGIAHKGFKDKFRGFFEWSQ